jgi:hypothetical protein
MKALAPVLAITTIVAGAAAVWLVQQLHAEQNRANALQTRVTELEIALARPAVTTSPVAQTITASVDSPAATQSTPINAPVAASPATEKPATVRINSSELMKDPDYRASVAGYLRQSLAQNYQDFGKEQGLSPELMGKLLDIMASNGLAISGVGVGAGDGKTTPAEVLQASQAAQRKQEDDIRALLGDAKTQQWKDYQASLPSRQQVSQLRAALESSGDTLSQRQQQLLIATMTAEQKNRSAEMTRVLQTMGRTQGDAQAMLEQEIRTTEEGNSRIMDMASSYLNAQQLDALRAQQNRNLGASRAFLRAQRQQSGAGPSAGGAL